MDTIKAINCFNKKTEKKIVYQYQEHLTHNEWLVNNTLEIDNIRLTHEITLLKQLSIYCIRLPKTKGITLEVELSRPMLSLLFICDEAQQFIHFSISEYDTTTHSFCFDKAVTEATVLQVFVTKAQISLFLSSIDLNTYVQQHPKNIKATKWLRQSYLMPLKMLQVVKDVCHFKRNTTFPQYYLSLKAKELLLLQIEAIDKQQKNCIAISEEDYHKIMMAQELLVLHMHQPLSLITLARAVGTNDFKLKKYFKAIFGTTVFGYLTTLKMTKAQEKLQYSNLTINEIAESLGYKTQTHFTNVFKKYYGHPPSEVKRKRKIF